MATWTLHHVESGATKTFEEWGLTAPEIRFRSQEADTARFTYRGVWEEADDLFAYGDTIVIAKDSQTWFTGIVVAVPIEASAASEHMHFEVRGPWIYFEEHKYQVEWTSWNALAAEKIYASHIFYNVGFGGELLTTRTMFMKVLDFLLGLYPSGAKPFQYFPANILPGVDLYAPIHEDRDLTCSQVMQQLMRWHKDATITFDYSVNPPALSIRRRTQAEITNNLALPSAGGNVTAFDIVPRPDLQRPCAVVRYERRNVVNGEGKYSLLVDAYPPGSTGREFGALDLTVDLLGFNKTTVRGSLLCEAINIGSAAWWQLHEPKLASSRIANLSITEVNRSGLRQFPQELVEGQIAPWMELEDGTPVEYERDVITARATFQYYSTNPADPKAIILGEHDSMELSVRLVSTNAPAGDSSYEATESVEEGDPQPLNLAQYLFDQVKDLQFSGYISLEGAEVSGQVRVGNAVNLIGGRPEWATMKALVQSVTENIELGRTDIILGTPEYLGPQDLIELLKVGRRRTRWVNPKLQETGEELDEIALGKATANNDSGLGPSQMTYVRLTPEKQYSDAAQKDKAHAIILNSTPATSQLSEGPYIEIRRKDKDGLIYISLGTGPAGAPANVGPKLIVDGGAKGGLQLKIDDILEAVPAGDARVIKIREVCVKVNGQEKKMLVLGGAPY